MEVFSDAAKKILWKTLFAYENYSKSRIYFIITFHGCSKFFLTFPHEFTTIQGGLRKIFQLIVNFLECVLWLFSTLGSYHAWLSFQVTPFCVYWILIPYEGIPYFFPLYAALQKKTCLRSFFFLYLIMVDGPLNKRQKFSGPLH